MRTLSIRLDDATDALLRQICAQTQRSQTEVMKAAIAVLAERGDLSPTQSAAELNLIGCFDSGVGDLGRHHAQHLRDKLASKHPRAQTID